MPPVPPTAEPSAPLIGGVNPVLPPSRRRWKRWGAALFTGSVLAVAAGNAWVLAGARGRLHHPQSATTPAVPIALVLGTSPRRADGSPNLHFLRRMDAAAALHASGKVSILLVSGAIAGRYYDEPRDMRAALVARGVPDSAIVEDPSGVRTLDSVLRTAEAYRARECAIISDAWHVPRALYIADHIGLKATGVVAEPVPVSQSLKARSREWLARVLVLLDLHLLNTRPQNPPTGKEPDLSKVPAPQPTGGNRGNGATT